MPKDGKKPFTQQDGWKWGDLSLSLSLSLSTDYISVQNLLFCITSAMLVE